jgi:hypothetical protein
MRCGNCARARDAVYDGVMFKPTVLKVVIAVILGGAGYFLASNAHFDAFPCEKAYYNYERGRVDTPTSGMCSLLAVKRAQERGEQADYAKLTGGGYAMMVLLFGLLPYLIAAPIGHKLGRKKTA